MYVCLFDPAECTALGKRLSVWACGVSNRLRRDATLSIGPLHVEFGRGDADACAARDVTEPVNRATYRVARALITMHVMAVTVAAIPAPAIPDRSEWNSPEIHEEFAAWTERVDAWGFEFTVEELQDVLWHIGRTYDRGRAAVLAPLAPYFKYCGARQGWAMFVGPHREPIRLCIDVREAGHWRRVFAQHDPRAQWLSSTLDHEHMRTAIFFLYHGEFHEEITEFAQWIAGRAAADFPQADRVRVGGYKFRTLAPEQVRAGEQPTGSFVGKREIDLAGIRAAAP
jgi:hypothetical protein